MDDTINEVTLVEQDLLMTVDDFAKQECVTPRTVYRWIELGRLDTVERLGKKYVNASVPLKTAVNDNDNVGNDMKSKNAGALQNVNIFEEYLKTLRENSKRYEKSCRRWQMSCFASVFLFFTALLAGTAISLFYHYGYENLSDKLEASSTELAEVESGRTDALATVEDLNEDMELRLKPYKDENTRLRERIDELVARNDNLRDRLDVTFDRNAFLLQRFAEEAAISEVASVDPLEASDNTKN
jgi:cell division protein FtsB